MSDLTIANRIEEVAKRINSACARSNRVSQSVTLIAVSKTHRATDVLAAIEAGQLHFGENRIEEATGKISEVRTLMPNLNLTWHMIGHVQSRKAGEVISAFDLIHSLDTVKLAERYSRLVQEKQNNRDQVRVLLEVNVSGEESKSGFQAVGWQDQPAIRATLWEQVRQISVLPYVQIEGLMTMAPIVEDAERARPVFTSLRQLRDALQTDFPQLTLSTLSMGMTDDYEVAIEEGATMVRIGRAIFGERSSL